MTAVAALLAVAAVGALLRTLNRTAPDADIDLAVSLPGDLASVARVTCPRALPDATRRPGATLPPPGARVTSAQLVQCPDLLDGRGVSYVGEVVGDVLRRRGGAWVLMNDDDYALGRGPLPAAGTLSGGNSGVSVWLDGDLADLAVTPGGAGVRGDVLVVRATVHRADPADGGGLTLRATDGAVLARARRIEPPVHQGQAVAAMLLGIGALVMVGLERVTARRR